MRPPDWPMRLTAFAERVRGQPFTWGTTDCGSLARGVLEAVYGIEIPMQYASHREAAAVIAAASIPMRLRALGLRCMQATPLPGDILTMAIPVEDELAECAVCVGESILTADRKLGVLTLPVPERLMPVWRLA